MIHTRKQYLTEWDRGLGKPLPIFKRKSIA
jgi:hypothetical protein